MKALMDLKTDYAFKQVFGQPGTTAFLNPRFQREAAEGIFAVDLANTEITRLGVGARANVSTSTRRMRQPGDPGWPGTGNDQAAPLVLEQPVCSAGYHGDGLWKHEPYDCDQYCESRDGPLDSPLPHIM